MKFIIWSMFIGLFSYLSANTVVGKIELFSGNVKVKHEGSIKKSKVTKDFAIKAGDLISCSKKSTAKISLVDGSVLILDESSSVHFASKWEMEQVEGKILYKVTSRASKNAMRVKTQFAIIGIKGTTFIINATDSSSVSLKEGVISVLSPGEEFELYRKKVQDEFNEYASKQNDEFEKYKNAQGKYAVAEATKEFDVEAGNRVSFYENQVNEDEFTKDDDLEFERFEKLIERMK